MTRFSTAAAVLAATTILAAGAQAASLVDPVVEAAPVTEAPAETEAHDWTGFYSGVQLGFANVISQTGQLAPLDGDGAFVGVHAGYDYDFGDIVVGGEIDYDKMDITLGAFQTPVIESMARIKLKVGYDLGKTMIYATGGAVQADTDKVTESGSFLGLGVTHRINKKYSVGAEFLNHQIDEIGNNLGNDISVNTFSLRGSMRF